MTLKSDKDGKNKAPGFPGILLVLFLFYFGLTALTGFYADSHRVSFGDTPKHLEILHQGYLCDADGFLHPFTFSYPPLVYQLTLMAARISGFGFNEVLFVQALFWILLSGLVYLTGRRMAGRWAGLVSAFLCLSTPMIAHAARQYQLDLPLTAVVALGFLFLVKSRDLENRLYTYLFWITCGGGVVNQTGFPALSDCPPGDSNYQPLAPEASRSAGDNGHSSPAVVLGIGVIRFLEAAPPGNKLLQLRKRTRSSPAVFPVNTAPGRRNHPGHGTSPDSPVDPGRSRRALPGGGYVLAFLWLFLAICPPGFQAS